MCSENIDAEYEVKDVKSNHQNYHENDMDENNAEENYENCENYVEENYNDDAAK